MTNRRGFLGLLAASPLALLAGYNDGKDRPEGVEGQATLRGDVLEMPHGGEIHSCSFDGVRVVAGGPLLVTGCSFFNTLEGPSLKIQGNGGVLGQS
jgi:hypothetical protein